MDKPLTQKQYDFVLNYVKNGFNAYQASLAAGYSKHFAQVKSALLVEKPIIKERIEKAYNNIEGMRERQLTLSFADKAEILDRIIRAVVPADKSMPVDKKYMNEAIKALAELNKMGGDYAPDKRLSITVDATKERLIEARRQYEDY